MTDELDILPDTQEQDRDRARIRRRELDDLRKVLSFVEGRRFVWKLMSESGIFRASFTQNSNQTAFNEGQRSVGSTVLADLMAAKPEIFHQMFREAASEQASRQKEKEGD